MRPARVLPALLPSSFLHRCFVISLVLLSAPLIGASTPATAQPPPEFILQWGGQGTAYGTFMNPWHVETDRLGRVYVADYDNRRVQVFSSQGAFLFAIDYNVYPGHLEKPTDEAIDAEGCIFVTARYDHQVKKYNSAGQFLLAWGQLGDGDGEFNEPFSMAIDAAGFVYVADGGNKRIQKFTANGEFVTKWGSSGTGPGEFMAPVCLEVEGGDFVYVSDQWNHCVQKFTLDGTFVARWGGFGAGPGQFNNPIGVALDSAGRVYVADALNRRVQVFNGDGVYLYAWSARDDEGAVAAPGGLAIDGGDHVYVLDGVTRRVLKFGYQPVTTIPTTWGRLKQLY